MKKSFRVMFIMAGDETKTALVVVDNPIIEGRIKSVLSRKGWNIEICDDGDKAVDEYVKIRPDLTFIALDIPSMDGHVAALEIRESHATARLVFVTSKSRLEKAEDAAYSAGAVATLVTPLTKSQIDESWNTIMGQIPEAPGVADLDALYPEMEVDAPLVPAALIMPEFPPLPTLPLAPTEPSTVKTKGKKSRKILLLLIIAGGSIGVANYLGYIDIQPAIDKLFAFI
jgi:CheY-like chemotaxis protein